MLKEREYVRFKRCPEYEFEVLSRRIAYGLNDKPYPAIFVAGSKELAGKYLLYGLPFVHLSEDRMDIVVNYYKEIGVSRPSENTMYYLADVSFFEEIPEIERIINQLHKEIGC